MKKESYKILVLTDLKKSTTAVLKSAISLSKIIDGEIQLFHARKPTDIVEKENQLSAIRIINSEYRKTEKKIQNILNDISNEYHLNAKYELAFGNLKDGILSHITSYKPDIIVLGKRKFKPFSIIGDNITELVLKSFKGIILIADNKNTLEPNNKLSLGVLNNSKASFNVSFANRLTERTQKPLKSFKIVKNSSQLNEAQTNLLNTQTIEYVFEQSDNTISNLSKYLLKSNVNLLCLNRENEQTKQAHPATFNIKEVINKINVSILLAGINAQVE